MVHPLFRALCTKQYFLALLSDHQGLDRLKATRQCIRPAGSFAPVNCPLKGVARFVVPCPNIFHIHLGNLTVSLISVVPDKTDTHAYSQSCLSTSVGYLT